jgi:hypothetical protein
MTTLTERQRQVLEAALSYAFSNADDLNDALADDTDEDEPGQVLLRNHVVADSFREAEFEDLARLFGIEIR